jgi:hypothetical protein
MIEIPSYENKHIVQRSKAKQRHCSQSSLFPLIVLPDARKYAGVLCFESPQSIAAVFE